MRAISTVRTSRTVIDATTSSRLSFSLTLLCRMSRIGTAGPPSCLGVGQQPALCCPAPTLAASKHRLPLGLSAVLALRLALAFAPILPAALRIGLLLGAVPASAGSPSRYQEYDQGAYLPYVNAPGPSASPLLRVSFGGRSYAAVMDTGSTGVVVSADKIPNIATLQSLRPGQLTYSSSGRIMIGRWVVTPIT